MPITYPLDMADRDHTDYKCDDEWTLLSSFSSSLIIPEIKSDIKGKEKSSKLSIN